MYTGIYAFNPEFVDFGLNSMTFFAVYPDDGIDDDEEMERELQEINYRDIRTMRRKFIQSRFKCHNVF